VTTPLSGRGERGTRASLKQDYSAWLTPERLAVEDQQWGDPRLATWPIFVGWIKHVAREVEIVSVLEYGCGTGWVPRHLPPDMHYVGVDANQYCLQLAMARNPGRLFAFADVRAALALTFDLACAFSFLKHFGLHEWDEVVAQVLRHGRYGLFTMPVGPETKDDGTEFPHVWVTEDRLRAAVNLAGHEVRHLARIQTGETMVVTRLVPREP